ncbi:hypothetical protein [Halobacterium zhouii]|uniref:hypothetical protein n=1 Tax=Halobacterium zhouii TaxID=2902624 RepID=UPI001E5929B8|nr:hypothetical protein [Halobacterium zhouii]
MRTVLAVCALLLAAGCMGVPPLDGGDGPEAAEGFPPGVSAQGVENATKLANAHEAALAETGYAYEYELTEFQTPKAPNVVDATNETIRRRARLTATAVNETTFWANEYNTTTLKWHNQSRGARRITGPYGHAYYTDWQVEPDNGNPRIESNWPLDYAHAYNFTVSERVVRDSRMLLVLTADRNRVEQDRTTTFDARLVVDLSGRVHHYEYRRHVASEVENTTETLTYELTEIGVESVQRPEWASKARNAVDAFVGVDESQDGEHVVVKNEEGESLPVGSTVELTYAGKTHAFTLNQTLAADEQVFFSFPENGSDPLLAYEDGWRDYPKLDATYRVQVWGPDGIPVLRAPVVVNASNPHY